MKFYIKLFAFLAGVVVALILLRECADSGALDPPSASRPIMSTPAVTPQSSPVPTPVPPRAVASTVPQWLIAAARQAQANMVGAQYQDGWWYITVQGRDRNHLNDFLDAALTAGLKDVDHNYQAYRQSVGPGNRQVFQNTYKMRF